MHVLQVPSFGLVVLVGTSGSGKSSFAMRHFAPTEILSSDRFRAMICDDEADQSVSAQAFELLHAFARRRLEAGRLVVVDATNTALEARAQLLSIAQTCHAPAIAIVLEVPFDACLQNDAARVHRHVGRDVIATQAEALQRSLETIDGEGFARVYRVRGVHAIEHIRIERVPQPLDERSGSG